MKRLSLVLVLLLLSPIIMGNDGAGCSEQQRARNEALNKAQDRRAYVQKNDIEFKNYDRRQRLSDDPTAIMWCTSAFPIPSSPLFTIPIVGKITSGAKRPFPGDPGPDGMYGNSGEYRFGFTPGGVYADWYGLPLFCTNEPMIWQRQSTTIIMENDPGLMAAHDQAREALKAGREKEAYEILSKAIKQGGE